MEIMKILYIVMPVIRKSDHPHEAQIEGREEFICEKLTVLEWS